MKLAWLTDIHLNFIVAHALMSSTSRWLPGAEIDHFPDVGKMVGDGAA